jgi:hypothetical protein
VAIYRAEGGRRMALLAGLAAIVGLVLGLVLGRTTAPGLGAQLDDLRRQSAPISSSLEVIRTEYPKLLAGGGDPGGAEAAMAKVETTFAAIEPSVGAIDSAGTTRLGEAITQLRDAMTARVPDEELTSLLDAVQTRLDSVLPG